MTFRIAQISDTHLSDEKPFFVDNFVRIGEAIRASAPDLLLNSGDISLDGASDEADLAAARLLHDGLGLPVRFLPGNHDLGDSQDSLGHGEAPIDAGRRDRYVRHFGADWWTFDVPGWRVIGINAQLLGSNLKATEDQQAAVAQATVRPKRR
jgi:Icc protein